MDIDLNFLTKKKGLFSAMATTRQPWWGIWRELADYYLPKRYQWLLNDKERIARSAKSAFIIDGTGTKAGRVLAAGMMNGITSPSRPWFKLKLAHFADEVSDSDHVTQLSLPARRWLDEVERRMLLVMAQSNFYNCIAVLYQDMVFFGTGAMLVYEDPETVIRCYNSPLGEYYLGQDAALRVNRFAREIKRNVHQIVQEFGIENVSQQIKNLFEAGNANLLTEFTLYHLIEPNDDELKAVPKHFTVRELYWEQAATVTLLAAKGFYEMPGIFPRWEVTGNDPYGTSPAFDALGDVIQLQFESKRKAQALDFMVRPHMLKDISLQQTASPMTPGGSTYVAGLINGAAGAKPAYQFQPPINELTMDIKEIQIRIREIFHNDLFQMISQLQTVRTATEIDAREEEKLIQLGPVLERTGNEGLDPFIQRTFSAMLRAGLIPEPPPEIEMAQIQIQYVSILSAAQSAVGVAPVERLLALTGQLAQVYPEVVDIPDIEELFRGYAADIGVKARAIRSKKDVAARVAQRQQDQQMAQGIEQAKVGAEAGKLLSETDVGGGANALQQLISG